MKACIKAVIFDMDGVLIDAREWHYEALNRALGLFGFEISRYDHLVTYDGLPTKRKLEMLSRERGFPAALHGFVNQLKQQYTMELIHARCRPVFQHQYALSRLRSDGYQLAVCSNSIRMTVDQMLGKAALSPYLALTLSNEDVAQPKPSPDIYAAAIRYFGIAPRECLVVEDNANGIAAARAAGAHVMPVGTPSDVKLDAIRQAIERAEQSNEEQMLETCNA